jgi:hypothetical protein
MALKMRVVAAGDAAHFSRQNTHDTKPLVLISMSPDFKAAFMAWRTQSESTLPTRVNMRQRAYFMVPTPLSRHFFAISFMFFRCFVLSEVFCEA